MELLWLKIHHRCRSRHNHCNQCCSHPGFRILFQRRAGNSALIAAVLGHPFMAAGPMQNQAQPHGVEHHGGLHDSTMAQPGIPNDQVKAQERFRSKEAMAEVELYLRRESCPLVCSRFFTMAALLTANDSNGLDCGTICGQPLRD